MDTFELAKMINKGEIADELKKLLDEFVERGEATTVRVRGK